VERALSLLDAFTVNEPQLTLAEMTRRLGLPKTTVFRLARTLAARGYLAQLEGGAWRLGPAAAWLGARYQVAFDIHNTIEPIMRRLAKDTRRGVSYFVPEGNARVRLLHVATEATLVRHARVGESMPLDKGSPGQVLLAFAGRKGAVYEQIRKRGFHFTIGEARNQSASVSAPVYGPNWRVVGALCIGVAASGADEKSLCAYAPALMKAAERLSRALVAEHAATRQVAITQQGWRP